MFKLDKMKKFLVSGSMRQSNRVPREVVKIPSLNTIHAQGNITRKALDRKMRNHILRQEISNLL